MEMKTALGSKNAFCFFPRKVVFCVSAPFLSSVEILGITPLLVPKCSKVEHARYSGADCAFFPKMEIWGVFVKY